jgi:hypothetical protein
MRARTCPMSWLRPPTTSISRGGGVDVLVRIPVFECQHPPWLPQHLVLLCATGGAKSHSPVAFANCELAAVSYLYAISPWEVGACRCAVWI